MKDLDDRTLISALDKTCAIEIAAARRTGEAEEDEMSRIHEHYLRDEGIKATRTLMTENPCNVLTLVTRGVGLDEREHIVCHAYWKNYCAFIKYHGQRKTDSNRRAQVFYDLVDSLQPLALD